MWGIGCLLTGWAVILSVTGTEHFSRPGRRMCSVATQWTTVPFTESYRQPVYQPYLTTCEGHRACSTYRTIYRTAYRQASKKLSQPLFSCCPGWRRSSSVPFSCTRAICHLPCQNGGRCARPGRCDCPVGWQGDACQTDVDECAGDHHGCPQRCVNMAGSYRCDCWEGYLLSVDGKLCQLVGSPPCPSGPAPTTPGGHPSGASDVMKDEVQELRSRVAVLEQKLQLALAPIHSLLPPTLDAGAPDHTSLLTHSFQQLDRIDSLSEQISFLEERLETCSCKNKL
ncbi:epidermal growth factor-like protein 7 isoform X1 [Tachyglossus aculeatus]|uniref:epidermal growth factor-like protein 7 isoform X1 n=1 Tax=Tachyglossus aculeatus TaxID=9261 RepID=UPI0018F332EE|nr:epidermal growth factor-like protein 7 isoform X1 [Tachyglossus aculeatus]